MEILFVCYMIAFSIWNTFIWSKLSDIKDDLSAIRRLLEKRRNSMGLEYYKKELEAAFAEATLALSGEEYAELCEYLKENGVI